MRMLHAWDWGRWYWFCLPCGLIANPEYKHSGGVMRA
jgi:hypothetical protein